MNLTDLLADKPVEAAHLAFWSASKQDRDAIRAALRAVWEAAELAQEQEPAATNAKAESEVLDSSCSEKLAAILSNTLGKSGYTFLDSSISHDPKISTVMTDAMRQAYKLGNCSPSPTESAMREALEKAQAKFTEARNCLGQKEAFRLLEEASDIIDTALQIAKERG